MKFADFHVGQRIEAGPYELTEAEVLQFAHAWDPQWFHTDSAAAAAGRFGGLIASGWQTCGIAMRLAVDSVLRGSGSFASPGVEKIRWPHPVRPGDRLRLVATVTEVRRSRQRSSLGILAWRWQLFNGEDREVLDLQATSLFDLSAAAPDAGRATDLNRSAP